MNVKIIRGTNQIGGSAVEISTDKSRILIDFGAELCDEPSELYVEGVTSKPSKCDAIFFSHNHEDHVGLMNTINDDIPLFIGVDAKEIMKMLAKRTHDKMYNSKVVDRMNTYKVKTPVIINKEIKVTPYYVDHSAFDAYMFLIEADGKKVLYTGDFRTHGYIGKGLIPTLKKYIGKVDAIICEGTTIGGDNTHSSISENELKNQIAKVINENKYVFVMCASTNIYRIAGICSVVPRGKYLLMDSFEKKVVEYVKEKHLQDSLLYEFKKALVYSDKIEDRYKERVFVMFIRQNDRSKEIMNKFVDAKVIYSMWHGYLDKKNIDRPTIREWLGNKEIIELHTSGHADKEAIKSVIEVTRPDKVIPIHTEHKESFIELVGAEHYVDAEDNNTINI